jgi:hypothetical protein
MAFQHRVKRASSSRVTICIIFMDIAVAVNASRMARGKRKKVRPALWNREVKEGNFIYQ